MYNMFALIAKNAWFAHGKNDRKLKKDRGNFTQRIYKELISCYNLNMV